MARLVPVSLTIASFVLLGRASALEIRGYSAARHNRLIDFPGAPVFAQKPKFNPGFSPAAKLFPGIGWPAHPTDWTRQVALISPRHFVCATHYPPGADWRIAFLGADGKQHAYRIKSQAPVINRKGQATDLLLCTLAAPVPVKPFPVLNLPDEAEHVGGKMIVCGSFTRASTMALDGFTTLTNDPGFDTTRFAYFDYHKGGGGADDCNYQGGDSGAPAFMMVRGQPALIGPASGQDPLPGRISRNYISFMPAYLDELDALMDAQGYHVRRFHPGATSVDAAITAAGELRRGKPGSCAIQVRNTGARDAHNLELTLTFSAAPGRVKGEGWICNAASPLVWNCRRGGLVRAAQTSITAQWERLPESQALQISAVRAFDGASPLTTRAKLLVSSNAAP